MQPHKNEEIGAVTVFNSGDVVVRAGIADVILPLFESVADVQGARCVSGLESEAVPGKNPCLDPRMNGQVISGAKLNQFECSGHGVTSGHAPITPCERVTISGKADPSRSLS